MGRDFLKAVGLVKTSKKVKIAEKTHQEMEALVMKFAVFYEDFETVTVSPGDFPWLDESYYDSVQKDLELFGFSKVQDGELLHFSLASPEVRTFYRLLINAERNICATIMQFRVVEPQDDEQRNMEIRCVEFTSECSDGTFLVTTNTLGVNNLEDVEGISFCQLPPDVPLDVLQSCHMEQIQSHCDSTQAELLTRPTDADIQSAGERQHLLMRAAGEKQVEVAMQDAMRVALAENFTDEPNEELLEWLEAIRTDLLALYEKAIEAKTDIVTFYY
jgi:hypothetical protein